MPDESARRGAVVTLQILLAMMFLAIIGGTAGYLLGMRQKDQASAHGGAAASQSPTRVTSTGRRCLAHTEALANVGPLYQVLYLQTAKSEIWICKAADGALFYQGHRGGPSDRNLQEGGNALFLPGVVDNGDEYVATNTNTNGEVTTFHVNRKRLIIVYTGFASPIPDETQTAVGG